MVRRGLAVLAVIALSGCLDARRGAVTAIGGADADAAATTDDAASDTHDAAPFDPDVMVLDPASLTYFHLPIDSVRHAVSGYDPARGLCATLVWWGADGHCQGDALPYVLLTESADGACGQWNYGGNVEVTGAVGCVDLAEEGPGHLDLVDVEVAVTSDFFSGRIVADDRATRDPRPVTLGIRFTTDIPETVWVQRSDALGLPGWVRITRDGQPVAAFDRCDLPICGEETGVCGVAMPQLALLTGGGRTGQIALTWDGLERRVAGGECAERVPAPPGDYVATFCLGWQVDRADGLTGTVTNPVCHEVHFDPSAEEVFWNVDFGG